MKLELNKNSIFLPYPIKQAQNYGIEIISINYLIEFQQLTKSFIDYSSFS